MRWHVVVSPPLTITLHVWQASERQPHSCGGSWTSLAPVTCPPLAPLTSRCNFPVLQTRLRALVLVLAQVVVLAMVPGPVLIVLGLVILEGVRGGDPTFPRKSRTHAAVERGDRARGFSPSLPRQMTPTRCLPMMSQPCARPRRWKCTQWWGLICAPLS